MTAPNGANPDLLSGNEARRYLRMSPNDFYRLVNAGEIPAFRRGRGWWFLRPQLDAYLRAQTAAERSAPTPLRRPG